MTKYETWSLVLTATYDLLTFLLIIFVAYEAIIKPRRSNIAFYFQRMPRDTKNWSWIRPFGDFVLENRGTEIKNVRIKSQPDYLGWGNLGTENRRNPRSTSEYFKDAITFLSENERQQFFWCDMEANAEVLKKPFEVIIEFDNPALPLPRRVKKTFKFDFSALEDVIHGIAIRYDVHNVALETARIREELGRMERSVEKIADHLVYMEQNKIDDSASHSPTTHSSRRLNSMFVIVLSAIAAWKAFARRG